MGAVRDDACVRPKPHRAAGRRRAPTRSHATRHTRRGQRGSGWWRSGWRDDDARSSAPPCGGLFGGASGGPPLTGLACRDESSRAGDRPFASRTTHSRGGAAVPYRSRARGPPAESVAVGEVKRQRGGRRVWPPHRQKQPEDDVGQAQLDPGRWTMDRTSGALMGGLERALGCVGLAAGVVEAPDGRAHNFGAHGIEPN